MFLNERWLETVEHLYYGILLSNNPDEAVGNYAEGIMPIPKGYECLILTL